LIFIKNQGGKAICFDSGHSIEDLLLISPMVVNGGGLAFSGVGAMMGV
jgi:hypothetical protein